MMIPKNGSHVTAPFVSRYLIAHACFACRRSWKLPVLFGGVGEGGRSCPACGGGLCLMGRSFKAPKRTDVAQWRKVEALWRRGYRFWSYRSHPGAEPLPATLKEVSGFLRRNPDHPMRLKPARAAAGWR
ncbi:hypothetical protein FBZ88_102403 [Nitrospirillum bahiense]|uniref:Uncharacterized protein n=2 Tax=Nitrospirillum amazonense TaxID=28077 RepID=A0A560GA90_9PROT|nr:hypothetical protein FBZ88_102403 [Nitrospirillum amazonense]